MLAGNAGSMEPQHDQENGEEAQSAHWRHGNRLRPAQQKCCAAEDEGQGAVRPPSGNFRVSGVAPVRGRFWHHGPVFPSPASAAEVDVVIERNGLFAGVEVKIGSNLSSSDFSGLRKMRKSLKEDFVVGVVLYAGRYLREYDADLYALPMEGLWSGTL